MTGAHVEGRTDHGTDDPTRHRTDPPTVERPVVTATSSATPTASPAPSQGVVTGEARLLSASALMAAGTVVSRASGFVRSALLVATLGLTTVHADVFNIANTIPNALYILLAGGVFNAVLVPQLVRSMQRDDDGGDAYTSRVITVAGLFLAVVTVALVLAAPLLMDLYLNGRYDAPALAGARSSAVDLARLCLPQVFFYGMFVLVGQVLNARGRFGAMMWAPIANNVVAVAMLVVYLVVYGTSSRADRFGGFTAGQELLLGVGSTAGIVVQLFVLVPYLRAAGLTFRPRFDLRGSGLGHTLRLGIWTVLFVVVNQIAYTVVVNLASGAVGKGGYTLYTSAFLLVTVPHAVVTVSLATAVLPTLSALAARGDLRGLGDSLAATLRSAVSVMLPFAALMPLVAFYVARVYLHGAAANKAHVLAPVLALFAPGILLFTVHYLLLRGLYALEQNRTVFLNQVWVAVTNVAVAVVLVHHVSSDHVVLALAGAYLASYAVGGALTFVTLRRRLGGLDTANTLRFLVRLAVAVALSASAAGALTLGLDRLDDNPSWPIALVFLLVVAGVFGGVYLALARLMHIREVTTVLQTLTRRLSRA